MSLNHGTLAYYKTQGKMSDPGSFISMLENIPDDPKKLRLVVQNCLIHIYMLWAYELELPEERKQEVCLRSMGEKLKRLTELGYQSVSEKHALDKHLVGNCRDFSVFLCSLLRSKGIPARERCGFARYFTPGKYEDHWICDYWDNKEERWIMMDAQLDDIQKEKLNISFDPSCVPADSFLYGGKAWQLCREKKVDPNLFGIQQWWGIDYVKSNFLLDVASLRKMPMLPWDTWNGLKSKATKDLTESELCFLDELAVLALNPDENFTKINDNYNQDDSIRVPEDMNKVLPVWI
jgi:hypothetical protein